MACCAACWIGIGISTGGSILVAQHLGGDERRLATQAASQTVTLSAVGALALGALGYLFVDDVLAVIGASPRVLALSVSYMRIISLGLVFMFRFLTFMALMRGAGDTVTPMIVVAGSVGLNLVLDPLLIFGWGPFPEWGIRGAAIATIISRGLAFGVGLWVMIRSDAGIRVRVADLRPTLDRVLTQLRLAVPASELRLAVPASVEGISRTLSLNLLLLIVGLFPTTVVAGYGIGTRVLSLVYLPAVAVARGIETMTGQNIGASQPDRAETAAGFAGGFLFVILSMMAVVTWVWAEAIVGLFTTDAEVTRSGAVFLRHIAPTFGFIGLVRVYNASFRGAGRTLTAAVIG
ncbi:MAG: MATE family efflux transporter [Halobacteriales archaeon]